MITILYDTAMERDAFKEFILTGSGCVDFSDQVDDMLCVNAPAACRICKDDLIRTQMIDRTEYQSIDFLRPDRPEKSCNTCDNAPICWLACTAAAPAPCRHYKPLEVQRHDVK